MALLPCMSCLLAGGIGCPRLDSSASGPIAIPCQWESDTLDALTQVEDIPQAGLIHQQHYSNFYHMFSEVAPTIHFLMCKYLGDCTYSRDSK